MNERRRTARQKSFLQGRIFFNNRRNSVDCLIRDFSDLGARLKFSGTVATPELVELHVPNKNETYRARVQWRSGDEIGVSFDNYGAGPAAEAVAPAPSPAPGAAPPADWAARIHKLEHDVLVLQRKFNELQAALRQQQGTD
jgi:hypothetical protein